MKSLQRIFSPKILMETILFSDLTAAALKCGFYTNTELEEKKALRTQ